jgi:hypothetical protein
MEINIKTTNLPGLPGFFIPRANFKFHIYYKIYGNPDGFKNNKTKGSFNIMKGSFNQSGAKK